MHNLFLIACISKDRGLGRDGQLLWKIPGDMQFFRATTMNNTVIMGRKTFESIGKPLPNRRNIVLSRQDVPGVQTYHSKQELDTVLAAIAGPKFIIGGASLYQMYLNEAEKLFLTEVQAAQPADTYFPEFDQAKYLRKIIKAGQQDHISYEIVEYAIGNPAAKQHSPAKAEKRQEPQNQLNRRGHYDLP